MINESFGAIARIEGAERYWQLSRRDLFPPSPRTCCPLPSSLRWPARRPASTPVCPPISVIKGKWSFVDRSRTTFCP